MWNQAKLIFLPIQFSSCQEAGWILFWFGFVCFFVFMRMSMGECRFHLSFYFNLFW